MFTGTFGPHPFVPPTGFEPNAVPWDFSYTLLDTDGKPVVGLSLDAGNGVYYFSHWRSEGFKSRPSFGSDEAEAIRRFRDWNLRRGGSFHTIEKSAVQDGGIHAEIKYIDGHTKEAILPSKFPDPVYGGTREFSKFPKNTLTPDQFKTLFPGESVQDVAQVTLEMKSKLPRDVLVRAVREWITEDKTEFEEAIGLKFVVVAGGPSIPLDDLIAKFEDQPHYKVNPLPGTRKADLKETKTTWQNFCDTIHRKTVAEITKADVHHYYRAIIAKFHAEKYSPRWVKKQFYYVQRVFPAALKEYEDVRDLEQVRVWCNTLLIAPEQVPVTVATMIKQQELNVLLAVSNPLERAIIMLSINAAYGNTDCARCPVSAIDWRNRTVTLQRQKKGRIPRSSILFDETLAAIQEYRATLPAELQAVPTLFINPETKAGYHKDFFCRSFVRVVKAAVAEADKANKKIKDKAKKLVINPKLTHSNCRDSFRSICEIKGDGLSNSALAVMGHAPVNKIASHYIDPRVYPQVVLPACQAVAEWYGFHLSDEAHAQTDDQKNQD